MPEIPGSPAPLVDPPPCAPLAVAGLRGANQSLVFSSAGAEGCSAGWSRMPSALTSLVSRVPASDSSVAVSASATGVRTTTGGMGRDPGMLIRIRVVSVVSVLRSCGCVAGRPATAPSSDTAGMPYGGVPEG
jgi:hypothetical protein